MTDYFSQDLTNVIIALKHYIIAEEQRLADKNAGDYE